MKRFRSNEIAWHLMLLPGMILLIAFSIIPMFGIVMAFQRFIPARGILGSAWVGLDNFRFLFDIPEGIQAIRNTLIIAIGKIVFGLFFSLVFALALNTVRTKFFKKASQTIVFLPFFISWAVLGYIYINVLDLRGPINNLIYMLGGERIFFMISNTWFRTILITTDVLRGLGYNTVIFIAAIVSVDPTSYEAAAIDGASKFQQLIHITLPGIKSTIILLSTLSLGNVLNAGFEQVFIMYNPLVYETGDIIDTYVYRIGLVQAQFGLATAMGLFRSAVGFVLIIISYKLASRFAGYRIF